MSSVDEGDVGNVLWSGSYQYSTGKYGGARSCELRLEDDVGLSLFLVTFPGPIAEGCIVGLTYIGN